LPNLLHYAVYSTYLGGTNGYEVGQGIAVDSGGDAYVAGGVNATDFPTTPCAFQPNRILQSRTSIRADC
jgi:Beta-propeller repeat